MRRTSIKDDDNDDNKDNNDFKKLKKNIYDSRYIILKLKKKKKNYLI